jgi:hypothetical protein
MNKAIHKRCPKCGKFAVRKEIRQCGECKAELFFPGDQPFKQAVSNVVPWFMFLVGGPRGTGWYRKASIVLLYGNS